MAWNNKRVSEKYDYQLALLFQHFLFFLRADTGVLSSFYSYFTLAEPVTARGPSAEEQEAIRQAHRCIQECHVEQLITESKFLREDSLHELLKVG